MLLSLFLLNDVHVSVGVHECVNRASGPTRVYRAAPLQVFRALPRKLRLWEKFKSCL